RRALATCARKRYGSGVHLWLRRLAACLLAALVLVESSGAARAFSDGATVSCCCGSHSAARRCRCVACPVASRRAHRSAAGDRLAPARECSGDHDDAGVLAVIAPPAAPRFSVEKPFPTGTLAFREVALPASRLVDAGRPPP